MLGAIAGDIIGSRFERHNTARYDFRLFTEHSTFTDDTVMTVAVMESLNGRLDLEPCLRKWQALFPNAGYGPRFLAWMGGHAPGDSKGNGGAMRVAPYAWMPYAWDDFREIVQGRTRITHNSWKALIGAWALASTIRHAREGQSNEFINAQLQEIALEYRNLIWPPRMKKPGPLARESVPVALAAALSSTSFEDAIRRAVSIGGDSDTIASMAGAVAEALYGVPDEIVKEVRVRLTTDMLKVLDEFYENYVGPDTVHSVSPRYKANTAMSKTGQKTVKGIPSSMREASADDPIYRRGFAVGEMRLTSSSKPTAERSSPGSTPSSDPQAKAYEDALRASRRDTETPSKEAQASSGSKPNNGDATDQ